MNDKVEFVGMQRTSELILTKVAGFPDSLKNIQTNNHHC